MGKLFDSSSNETESAQTAEAATNAKVCLLGNIGNESACHILSHLITSYHILSHLIIQSASLAWILRLSASFTRSIQILLFRDFVG